MTILTLFTKLLHYLPGEISHHIALKGLKTLHTAGVLKYFYKINSQHISKKDNLDITKLSNKLGIAAGLDKNGDYIDCLAALGVDFIEVGTVTPRPQPGNPKPRIFRNRKEKSLLNRLGFNNKGVDHLVRSSKLRNQISLLVQTSGKILTRQMKKLLKTILMFREGL